MLIRGEIEFDDGHKHQFLIDSNGAANWSQWGCSPPYSGATVDLLDALAEAVSNEAEGAEQFVKEATG